jgi:uncharacterized RDD family membrane protein YckC
MNDHQSSAEAADEKRYGTGWRRVVALFLDAAAFAPLGWLDQFIWNHTSAPSILLPWVVLNSLAWLAYPIGFVAVFGQTLGKMACGVRVLDLQEMPVSFKQAVLREIAPVVFTPYLLFLQAQNILGGHLANRAYGDASGDFTAMTHAGLLSMAWLLVEVITMLTNRKRRALHDFIAGTVVVRVEREKQLLWFLLGLFALSLIVPELMEEHNMIRGK